MPSVCSIAQGKARFARLVQEAQAGSVVTITQRDEPVAYLIGKEGLGALVETMEILATPAAMEAIRDYEAGKSKSYRIEDLPD